MKWSAVSVLLAAPLALAGALQADLVARDYYDMGSESTVIVEEVVVIWSCNGGGEATKTVNQMSTMGSAPMATHTVGISLFRVFHC